VKTFVWKKDNKVQQGFSVAKRRFHQSKKVDFTFVTQATTPVVSNTRSSQKRFCS
jgi:hypothetical protein